MDSSAEPLKVVLIGDAGTGKTSLLARWADDRFDPEQRSTIGVAFRLVDYAADSGCVKMQVWDTAGQETFRATSPLYCRNAHAAMIVFDVAGRSSFESVRDWLQILQQGSEDAGFVVVGNKCDRADREVSCEEATALADELGCEYFETSATENRAVGDAFAAVAELALKRRAPAAEKGVDIVRSARSGRRRECC